MKKILVFMGWGMTICLFAWSTAGYAQVSVGTVNNRVVQGGTTSSTLQPIVQSSSAQAQSGGTSTSGTQTSQGSTSTKAQASGSTTQTNTQQQAAATRNTKVADSAVATVKNTVDATYNSQTQEFTFTDANGQQKTMKLTDISGLTKDWIDKAGIQNGDKINLGLSEDGKAILVTNSDKDGNKVWEYDSQSHAMSYYHTSGALKGKLDYVTSESTRKYTFRGEGKDPGVGKDGHVITQKCFYDSNNNLSKIEYYTWSAENRGKNGAAKKSDQQRYTRYKYREDTFTTPTTATCDVTATACNKPSSTKYFDDPRPINWEPVLKGTVPQDNQGRYFLKTKNDDGTVSYYMLTARQDGFD
ncbi:MAG: hypothetical protein PHE58_05230, partial [Candidatus Omnitrophica bacterium]|nr:hypothetical protein [Candidatus Omnitrophota bacterium]